MIRDGTGVPNRAPRYEQPLSRLMHCISLAGEEAIA